MRKPITMPSCSSRSLSLHHLVVNLIYFISTNIDTFATDLCSIIDVVHIYQLVAFHLPDAMQNSERFLSQTPRPLCHPSLATNTSASVGCCSICSVVFIFEFKDATHLAAKQLEVDDSLQRHKCANLMAK